ncbi:hypothetical protein F2Q68_00015209 [Brassica cretica]|uniref:Uncharacterized protein n=1 Tax=Brassica cretica TaxID=69181 RepID=A0A8S9HP98_BRACR|nr:hypothetical protein F2Q68_00015209 [Brassica cretica]
MHGFGWYPLIDVRDSSVATLRPGPRWIGRYVATDSFAGLSLRCDRPSGLVKRCRLKVNCETCRLSDWSGGRLIIMAWMKTVFSRIAKDVVGKGPDHGTFVLRLSSKRILNSG